MRHPLAELHAEPRVRSKPTSRRARKAHGAERKRPLVRRRIQRTDWADITVQSIVEPKLTILRSECFRKAGMGSTPLGCHGKMWWRLSTTNSARCGLTPTSKTPFETTT